MTLDRAAARPQHPSMLFSGRQLVMWEGQRLVGNDVVPRVAVDADGRRLANQGSLDTLDTLDTLDELVDGGGSQPGQDAATIGDDRALYAVLDHAGPSSAPHRPERPVALSDDVSSPCPLTGRRPRGLREVEREVLAARWADGAATLRRLGVRPLIAVDDDSLWYSALSPLWTPEADARARHFAWLLAVLRACAPIDLCLTLEDAAPGGLSPSTGLGWLPALVEAAGARLLAVSAGTSFLLPLHHRRKGTTVDHGGADLSVAVWAARWARQGRKASGRTIDVVGVTRGVLSPSRARAMATASGLAGVWWAPPAGVPS